LPSRELPAPPPLPRADGTFTHAGLIPLHIFTVRLEEPAAPATSSGRLDPDPISGNASWTRTDTAAQLPIPEVRHP
jgi:hypothetical protein